MLEHITPYEALEKEAIEIDSFLNETISDIPAEWEERGNKLASYNARTGKMLADARYHLNEAKKSEVVATLTEVAKKTPYATNKAVNALIDSICRKEQYLVDWIARLNASTVHQIDWLRTLISKAKEEARLQGYVRK